MCVCVCVCEREKERERERRADIRPSDLLIEERSIIKTITGTGRAIVYLILDLGVPGSWRLQIFQVNFRSG